MKLLNIILISVIFTGGAFGEESAINQGPISIRGLSVDSTPEVILGKIDGECYTDGERNVFCRSKDNDDRILLFYKLSETGDVETIGLDCSFINGCRYSLAELAGMLSETLNLSEPKDMFGFGYELDGPAGDSLYVTEVNDRQAVYIKRGNYGRRGLILQ